LRPFAFLNQRVKKMGRCAFEVEVSSPRETKVEEELTHLDWLGAAIAWLGTMFCCLFALFIGPWWHEVLVDFGVEIPALIQLALRPWFPLLLGLIPTVMVALALVRKTSLGVRRGLIVAAAFLSLLASGFCLYAVYAPRAAVLKTLEPLGPF